MNLSYLRIMKSLLCFLRISYNYDFLQFLEKSNVDQLHNNWYYRFLSQNVGSCFGNCRQFVVRTQRIGQPLFSTTKLTDVILSTNFITKSRILTLSLIRKHTLTIKLALSRTLTLKTPLILMRIGKKVEWQNYDMSVWQMETSIYIQLGSWKRLTTKRVCNKLWQQQYIVKDDYRKRRAVHGSGSTAWKRRSSSQSLARR